MKLKEGFIFRNLGEKSVAVATGKVSEFFDGVITNNATAAFIFDRLKNDTTEEAIVDAVLDNYEIDRETAAKDVHELIAKLREHSLLDE